MQKIKKGIYQHTLHESEGNSALLVVVDSNASWNNFNIVKETILVSLEHFGFPYRIIDLAHSRISKDVLIDCSGVILAQDRIASSLTEEEADLIGKAVEETGQGLMIMDPDIRGFPPSLIKIFGFERINPAPYVTDTIIVNNNSHYITEMQEYNEFHRFDRMVSAFMVEKWGLHTIPLVQAVLGKEQLIYSRHFVPYSGFRPGNYPVVFASNYGKGRAVQFTISPRIWRRWFFGRCRGIDDLFYRSIIWMSVKPFIANLIPPFTVISFDDCTGRHNFRYTDILTKYKYIPMVSLFIRDVSESLYPVIRRGLQTGRIQFNSHALNYYNLIPFNFGRGEYTEKELEEIFNEEDSFWRKIGVSPGHTVRHHWGEYGVKSLPFLKERGRIYLNPMHSFGLLKSDCCGCDGYWPYNLPNYYYDYFPDDHDFFGFAAHPSRGDEDFLTGTTVLRRENSFNDIEKAAERAVSNIRKALRAGFFAEIITHEDKFDVLTINEWEQMIRRVEERTGKYKKIPASYDNVGPYLKGKDSISILKSERNGKNLKVKMEGNTDVTLKLSVFTEEDSFPERNFISISPFKGQMDIDI